jgi:ABC-type transport system involved in multi-copper enzyme maturation permease subunit
MTTTTDTTTGPAIAPTAPVPVRALPFARAITLELRKMLDTPAAWAVLLLVLGIGFAALGYRIGTDAQPPGFERAAGSMLLGAEILLPVIGLLAMTSEWTQRTALVTFTLQPRRGRVLAAKLLAVIALAMAATLALAAVAAVATGVLGVVTGADGGWGTAPQSLAAATVAIVTGTVMGAAFGALAQHTAAALVLYFALPMVWRLASTSLLGDAAVWLDPHAASSALADLDLTGRLAPTLTALAGWIVAPLVVGVVRTMRREVH